MSTATRVAPALRVVIGEDDVLLREGVARILLAAGLDVVASAGNADELLRKVLAFRPDIAIVDIRMPPRREDDGLLAAIQVRRRLPGTGVLILSQLCEPSFAIDLIDDRPEGVGYLLKERVGDVQAFVDTVRRVAGGGSALDPEVIALMLGRRGTAEGLTPREQQVLAAMAGGSSNLGISQTLLLSQASVEKHVTAIFRKLDLPHASADHRRVLAVLSYLQDRDRR